MRNMAYIEIRNLEKTYRKHKVINNIIIVLHRQYMFFYVI